MKSKTTSFNSCLDIKSTAVLVPFIMLGTIIPHFVKAQLCSNNKDSVYGLSTTGQIVSLNINNGSGVTIGAPFGATTNANGIGYSTRTNKFYFFNQNGSSPLQFLSYNPLAPVSAGNPSVLAAAPISATHVVRTGCVDVSGRNYYTIDSVNLPATHTNFLRYSITANNWTTITSRFVDGSNNPIPAIDTLISGDMAFDGNGNLWMLCSSKWNYALYEIKAPIPAGAVASVTVQTIIPVTAVPAPGFGKVGFTGIAFNTLGDMYLVTGNSTFGNNLYRLTSPKASALTFVATVPNDYGADLTSCTYPLTPLPVTWLNFTCVQEKNETVLSWEVNEDPAITGYEVQSSTDGIRWQSIYQISRSGFGNENAKRYQHRDQNTGSEAKFYRIVQLSNGKYKSYSDIKYVAATNSRSLSVGPNPVTNGTLHFWNKSTNKTYVCFLYDLGGKQVLTKVLKPEDQTLDLSAIKKGQYILKMSDMSTTTTFKLVSW